MIPYMYVQWFLLLQMLVWVNLYHSKRFTVNCLGELVFYLSGGLVILWLHSSQFQVGYFTPLILIQYVFFVMLSTNMFSVRMDFHQAVSLGFLVTFLNSFYWELPYHVIEVVVSGSQVLNVDWWLLRLPQLMRLGPLPFLYTNFRFRDYKYIYAGLVTGSLLTIIRFVTPCFHRAADVIHPIHRVLCLLLLCATIMEAERIPRDKPNG